MYSAKIYRYSHQYDSYDQLRSVYNIDELSCIEAICNNSKTKYNYHCYKFVCFDKNNDIVGEFYTLNQFIFD